MKNDTPLEATLAAAGPPLWRLQLIRVLQIIGIAGGFLGGAEFLQLLAFMPPAVASWLLVAGPAFAAGSKPLVMMVGDYLDDGVKNDSFKLPLVLVWLSLSFLVLSQSSCSNGNFGLGIVGDCALARYNAQNGRSYQSGPCIGADGKINRYITVWTNPDDVVIRTTRWTFGDKAGQTEVHYKATDGSWLSWGSKSGVSLGGAPVIDVTPPRNPSPVIP